MPPQSHALTAMTDDAMMQKNPSGSSDMHSPVSCCGAGSAVGVFDDAQVTVETTQDTNIGIV